MKVQITFEVELEETESMKAKGWTLDELAPESITHMSRDALFEYVRRQLLNKVLETQMSPYKDGVKSVTYHPIKTKVVK